VKREFDYRRWDYYTLQHHARYKAFVEWHGILCQDCGGAGGSVEPVLDDGSGPWEACGWCEGTGKVTRWLRGEWLRMKLDEARSKMKCSIVGS
jgi:hypothetical protein